MHDQQRLAGDLSRLGLPRGDDVIVHCSLRSIGPTVAGPATVLAALRDALGPVSTVVVPTQTANNSVTSPAFREATRGLTPDQVTEVEARIEGFDRASTPSVAMGALAEHIRRHPGAVRSAHPQASFAALGPRSAALMAVHDLDCHLGERSPLAALYAANAHVLLVGVGYKVCTALHLAEYRLPWRPRIRWYRCYMIENGRRVSVDFQAPDLDDRDFGALGREMDGQPFVTTGRVGNAAARAIPAQRAVDFAIGWMTCHRQP